MRHNRFPTRRGRHRAFLIAFSTAAIAMSAAAGMGFLMALSALAGWVAAGIAAAVAVSLRLDARPARHATPPPITRIFIAPAAARDREWE